MALNFKKFAQEGEAFINELAQTLNYPEDKDRAGRVLRSVLHALRDQITPQESIQMMAQFPMFLKAVYVMNWDLKTDNRVKHYDEFIDKVISVHGKTSDNDFPTDEDVERAIDAVFRMLRQYLSLGEIEDVRAVLPKELKPMFNSVLMI